MAPKRIIERWDSKRFNIGYIYNRGGIAYINIAGKVRRSTKMMFAQKNRAYLMQFLDDAIIEYMHPGSTQLMAKNHTISTLMEEYRKSQANHSPVHLRRLEYAFTHFLNEDYQVFQINEIRDNINDNLRTTILNPNNTKKLLQSLQKFFVYATDEGYMARNPIVDSMMPTAVKSDFHIFDPEEIEQIIAYFETRRPLYALLVRFISITGSRINETLGIQWEDINHLRILIRGKGGRDRVFPIEPFPTIKPVLKALKKLSKGSYLFDIVSVAVAEKQFRNACKKLNLYVQGKNFHAIRKMRENQLITEYGLDYSLTAELFGHTRQVQEKHYLETMKEDVLIAKITEQMSKY